MPVQGLKAGRRRARASSRPKGYDALMSNLHLAAGVNGVVIGIGYVIGALLIIAIVCFGVAKLFGGTPRTRWHERGAVGAGEEQIDPDDGTPHTFDS